MKGRSQGKSKYVHAPEAAAMLGCSDMTVRRLALAGRLHGYRLTDRGRYEIERESVERLLRERRRANFVGARGGRRR